jgi:hypothetical protein
VPDNFPFKETYRNLNSARGFIGAIEARAASIAEGRPNPRCTGKRRDPWGIKERLRSLRKLVSKTNRAYNKELRAFKKANK